MVKSWKSWRNTSEKNLARAFLFMMSGRAGGPDLVVFVLHRENSTKTSVPDTNRCANCSFFSPGLSFGIIKHNYMNMSKGLCMVHTTLDSLLQAVTFCCLSATKSCKIINGDKQLIFFSVSHFATACMCASHNIPFLLKGFFKVMVDLESLRSCSSEPLRRFIAAIVSSEKRQNLSLVEQSPSSGKSFSSRTSLIGNCSSGDFHRLCAMNHLDVDQTGSCISQITLLFIVTFIHHGLRKVSLVLIVRHVLWKKLQFQLSFCEKENKWFWF